MNNGEETTGLGWLSRYTSKSPTLFFRDGKRRIDYVLVYSKLDDSDVNTQLRSTFLSSLADESIEIEVEDCYGKLIGQSVVEGKGPSGLDGPTIQALRATSLQAAVPTTTSSQSPTTSAAAAPMSSPTPHKPVHVTPTRTKASGSPPSGMDRSRLLAQSETEVNLGSATNIFVKLHVPWRVMMQHSEMMQIRKPLKKLDTLGPNAFSDGAVGDDVRDEQSTVCGCLKHQSITPLEPTYTWPFAAKRQYLFDIPKEKETFFTAYERSLVVDFIIRRCSASYEDNPSPTTGNQSLAAPDDNTDDLDDGQMMDIATIEADVTPDVSKSRSRAKRLTGIAGMLKEGAFLAAYPLHEPSPKIEEAYKELSTGTVMSPTDPTHIPIKEPDDGMKLNNRSLLRRHWSSYKKAAKYQPIGYVRYYFGESIAFYFAWLGFYTYWLVPVAIIGLLIFLLGLVGMGSDPIVSFVCNKGQNITMCPRCTAAICKYWTLNSSCLRTKLNRLVDNEGTVIFGIIMAIWAILFLELWKRKQAELAYRWSVFFLEPVDQPPRPEFMALLDRKYPGELNPITGSIEPKVPFWSRKLPFSLISYSTILLGVVLTLAGIIGVILYKIVVKLLLRKLENSFAQSMSGMIATITGSCINLILIFVMKFIYDRLAVKMTDLENHRTQFQYDNSLSLKLYLLQFVNYYASVFYIAFIQGTTTPLPGTETVIIRSSGCDQGDCLFELFTQLIIIMVGKQLMSFIMETTMPYILRFVHKIRSQMANKKLRKERAETTGETGLDDMEEGPIEPRMLGCRADFTMLDPGSRPLFGEYLEMLIQFGFTTMFVPAFPLAPLFALINNVFELRADAKKFTGQYRRPVIERVKSIGIWLTILSVISSIAIRTNACIIAFTTRFIDRWVYRYQYSTDDNLVGFMNHTLAYMETNRFHAPAPGNYCRYEGYREPPWLDANYQYTAVHYHVLAAKFIFVFLFETVSVLLTSFISTAIDDVPAHVRNEIIRERSITHEAILQAEITQDKPKSSPGRHGMNAKVLADAIRQANRMSDDDDDDGDGGAGGGAKSAGNDYGSEKEMTQSPGRKHIGFKSLRYVSFVDQQPRQPPYPAENNNNNNPEEIGFRSASDSEPPPSQPLLGYPSSP